MAYRGSPLWTPFPGGGRGEGNGSRQSPPSTHLTLGGILRMTDRMDRRARPRRRTRQQRLFPAMLARARTPLSQCRARRRRRSNSTTTLTLPARSGWIAISPYFAALLTNNFNIILAALDVAARKPPPTQGEEETAKRVRNQLCLGEVCHFDRGCGCLTVIAAALRQRADEATRDA